MHMKPVNPWTWQDGVTLGFSQAIDVRDARRVVYCAGQTSVDANGKPLFAGDMTRQIHQAVDNLDTVLRHAGLTLSNVVRLSYYTTDLPAFLGAAASFVPRLTAAGCKPASTLLVVAGLFHPDVMIEIEATAVE
jgi:enamine deaminase RidA (YjgF/YER057c/UK114 family)